MATLVQILERDFAKKLFNKNYNDLTVKEKIAIRDEVNKKRFSGK